MSNNHGWCSTNTISVEYIENLVLHEMQQSRYPDKCYISYDLLAELTKHYISGGAPVGGTVSKLMSSAGPIDFQPVPNITNFCHVGNESSFERLEWVRVGRIFEEEVLNDESPVYR